MAGTNTGFTISAALVDNVSKQSAAISRTLQELKKSAESAGTSSKTIADVNMSRITEGVKSLGGQTLEFARSLERTVSPMAVITSATTLGGVLALGAAWAGVGTSLRNVGYSLSTPVGQISALRQGLKLAHVDAGVADTSLQSLLDKMVLAKNGGPGGAAAAQSLNQLGGVDWIDKTTGQLKPVMSVLDQIADKVQAIKDPHAQKTYLETVLGNADMLPALKNGSKGLHDLEAAARGTGSVMTGKMAKDFDELNSSLAKLGETFEGVGMKMADKFAPGFAKAADALSAFVSKNSELVAGLTTLMAIKPAAWILKFLGLGAFIPGAATAATIGAGAAILATPGDSPVTPQQAQSEADYRRLHGPAPTGGTLNRLWREYAPGWAGGGPQVGPVDNQTVARARTFRDKLLAANIPGMTPNIAAGFAGNSIQESNANPNGPAGDNGAAHGLLMWRDERLANFKNLFGHLPEQGTMDEAVAFTKWELQNTEADAWQKIRATGGSPAEAGAAVSTFFERPKDTVAEEQRRAALAQQVGAPDGAAPAAPAAAPASTQQASLGTGRIDVHIHGAPPGTVAKAQSTGQLDIRPPNIGTGLATAW